MPNTDTAAVLALCEQARGLADAATPGPWMVRDDISQVVVHDSCCEALFMLIPRHISDPGHHDRAVVDMEFSAAARDLVPQLAAVAAALVRERDALQARCEQLERELLLLREDWGVWRDRGAAAEALAQERDALRETVAQLGGCKHCCATFNPDGLLVCDECGEVVE